MTPLSRLAPIFPVIVCFACSGAAPVSDDALDASAVGEADAGIVAVPDAGTAVVDAGTPFVDAGDPAELAPKRWPDETAVTHDVDRALAAVLERSRTAGACDRYAAGATDRETLLLCGKDMFFNAHFDTVGVPTKLLTFLEKHYADAYYGKAFSSLGFAVDPAPATEGIPIGLVKSTAKLGNMETHAFTCAACHFGQLPDGRWSVGYANMRLQYGKFIASLPAPITLSTEKLGQATPFQIPGVPQQPPVHADLRAAFGPTVDRKMNDWIYKIELADLVLGLTGISGGGFSLSEDEVNRFMKLRPGTMDFLTKPLLDDTVWTVSRIISLWNLPSPAQRTSAHMPHELLSWAGGAETLMDFLHGFAAVGTSTNAGAWTDARLKPLEAYIYSLRTPPLETPLNAPLVHEGARLFASRGCLTCHLGPSGEGNKVFKFEEIGTDRAMAKIFNPDANGLACCGIGGGNYRATRGIKASRLAGEAFLGAQLHNGAVRSLEELFCLDGRDPTADEAQTSIGHSMTCDGLQVGEKLSMIAYLRSL